ncbi:MAG: OsmC family protein [Bacteroidetes bacterium]|nr:OsmC family protein [Bacteroidota bacterium]
MKISTVLTTDHLRTQATHLRSGNRIITDAPPDNHGKGEAFSPTDLMSTSLACCMMTIMGIEADRLKLPQPQIRAEVTKVMAPNPRRVVEIQVEIEISCAGATDTQRQQLEHAGRNCPVAHSLHPDLKQQISFQWV